MESHLDLWASSSERVLCSLNYQDLGALDINLYDGRLDSVALTESVDRHTRNANLLNPEGTVLADDWLRAGDAVATSHRRRFALPDGQVQSHISAILVRAGRVHDRYPVAQLIRFHVLPQIFKIPGSRLDGNHAPSRPHQDRRLHRHLTYIRTNIDHGHPGADDLTEPGYGTGLL
jgi:hypothetical protein